MRTMTMYISALLITCSSLVACGKSSDGYEAPVTGPKGPAFNPTTTQVVVIKNSVLADIAAYTAPGLSTDLKMECTVTGTTVYCGSLVVVP